MTPIRVLVVDDDFRVASMHAGVVAGVPECVVAGQATTLQQARELLADGVDLVIADQYLPDGFGIDLIGAGDASVLLVSAAGDPQTVRKALVRGAIGYLVKPFELSVLGERVRDYVRFRQASEGLAAVQQADIDAWQGLLRPRPDTAQQPKGRSAVTASSVIDLLRERTDVMSVNEVAESIGISRATARRYLSDLVDTGDVKLLLRYGTAGRPQHGYVWSG